MTKGDKVLIVFIILISILSFVYINRYAFSNQEKYVSVQVNGEEVKKILFDEKLIGETIPINTEYGYNLLEIGDERIRFYEADCPDQICVRQGFISRVGETLVCLPNKLVVELKGISEEDDIDIMSY
ncbi:MAG: NusG domain II-containing protein [Gudongella sp.]|nr:NusG domain II-containing protein [Gudongella sp.]